MKKKSVFLVLVLVLLFVIVLILLLIHLVHLGNLLLFLAVFPMNFTVLGITMITVPVTQYSCHKTMTAKTYLSGLFMI